MKRDEETTSLSTFLATPMGKVMSSGGPEYTPEEVVTMQAADAKAEIPAEQVLVQQVAELNDPNAPDQTKDEWRRRTQLKKSLQEQGLLDSDFMATTKGVGGLVMTIADGVTSPLRYDPRDENGNVIPAKSGLEYVSRYNPLMWPASVSDALNRSPATLNYAGELLEQGYGIMGDGLAGMGGPRYKVKETGAFITEMDRAMYRAKVAQTGGLAGDPSDDTLIKQYAGQGMTLEPVTPEDVEEFEYQQHLRFRGRLKSIEQKRTEGAGPEVVTSSLMTAGAAPLDLLTGSNYMDQVWGKKLPAESQAMIMQMGADPLVWTSFGAGLTRLGVSTAAKGGGARILDAIGKGAQKMARPTEQSLREVQRFQNAVWSKGRVAIYAGGLAGMNYSSLPEPLKNAMNVAAAAYVIHKGGAGTLRWVGDKFPQAAIMLREAADPLNGADIMARQAIAKNAKIPASIRERVARPSQFVSMESTPARLARNEALSPKTRKMMERLSNFYVVQGVRGASAVATGATKGAIAAVPFAELTRGGGDEEGANLIYGAGTALGGTGGAASRVFGARNRTVARAESDIGRMLVDVQGTVPELQRQGAVKRNQWFDRELNRFLTDVELAGGDIAHMFQARSFDEIARTAAMQGMFRNVDYVPLNDTDFALNAKAHGQSGAAGFYLHNSDGARPRLFVNLDARRADVDAHEFGEAFFSSDAFSPEQKAAMRAEVDARYGTDGVTARAREYAEQMIKSENARNFPNETLVVSDEQIRAKMDELAQDELGRGGQDPADWARREIMVEEWRMAGTDYARLRRGVPAGANPVTFVENILGANARALGLSGVRIDPETGQAVTPDQLFKENPVAADDPIVNRNLRAYIKTYNAWLNDPSQEAPSGVKVARDGNVQSFANNPNVDFYSSDPNNPSAPRENTFAVLGPDGRVIEKSPKQRRDERKARNTQVKNMAGRNLLAPGDAAFGLKRRADGRVVASGRRLPQSIILQNHWKPWLPIINTLETMADSNESMQVRYFAAGNSADKVKTAKPTDVVAINREMVFDQWTTNKDGDLLAQFLDLTSMRNRAMRAIGERNPALDPANGGPGYSLQAIMDDVNQWMADKRAGKAGEATIGPDRKNIVNALINPGTAVNRGKNPLAGSMGKGSAIKTLILEGINAVSGTGRKGAAMDYNWANGNFMPDQPPPRPDVDTDLPQERMPSALPQAGMAMPDAAPVRTLDTDRLLREYEENQGYLGLSTMGMREGRPVKGGAAETRRLLARNTEINRELDARGVKTEDAQLQRALAKRQTGQAMPDVDVQWETYAENLRDDVESWSPARDTGKIDYDMQDVVDSFVDFARTNPKMTGSELTAAFYRAEKPTASQRKKLNAAIANVGEPPKVATGGARGQAMPDGSQPVRGQAMADVGSAADETPRRLIDMPQSALKVLHANSAELPKPAKKLTNATVALTLADVAERHNNGIITSSNITPEQKSDLMILGADEAEAALKASGKNAGNWYSVAIEAALGIAGVIYRELSDAVAARSHAVLAKETDPVKAGQFALRLPLAITSQNMTVKLNTRASNEQFNIFLKTGKFDPSIAYGEKAKSISGNLDLANVMINELGSVLALEDFVSRTFTVRELEAEASSIAGRKITIAGRKDDIVNGAAIFGPKIGQGFLQNLMGKFDPVTIDLWMRRTWGRWTGDVVGDGVTAQRLARLVDQSRKSGRKLPDSIKRLRTTMRSMGETKTGKAKKPELTMSEDVEARLEAEAPFRKEVEAFAKEVNAEFQGLYKLMSDVMSPALAKKVQDAIERADRLPDQADAILSDVYNAVVREQSRVKQQLDKKWSGLSLDEKREMAARRLPGWADVKPQDRAKFIKKSKLILKGDWLEMQHQAEGRTAKLDNPQKNVIKPAWANAAKSIVSELNPIDIPSDMDRRVITEVVNGIREELERRGHTVTNADVQAILWYPEKDLWAKLRGEEESILKQSYDDEFINIAEGLGLGLEARKVAKQIRGY